MEARNELIKNLVEILKQVDEAGYQDGYEKAQEDIETGVLLNIGKPLSIAMDNVQAWRLGEAAQTASKAPAGDPIDRGLALRRVLEESGFVLIAETRQRTGS